MPKQRKILFQTTVHDKNSKIDKRKLNNIILKRVNKQRIMRTISFMLIVLLP